MLGMEENNRRSALKEERCYLVVKAESKCWALPGC
jgi:hypothetical protein